MVPGRAGSAVRGLNAATIVECSVWRPSLAAIGLLKAPAGTRHGR